MATTAHKFELIIQARAAQAVAEIKKATGQIQDGFTRGKLAVEVFNKTIGKSQSAATAATSQIRNLVAAIVSLSALKNAVTTGYRFNSVIEESRIGIAALIYSMNSHAASTGRASAEQDGFTAALTRASEVQEALRIEGLRTAATYEQISKAFSQSYVPAVKAGFDDQQVVAFTAAVTQAATAMRIPLDMLGEEVRSILRGVMTPRTTLLQPLMEAAGLTNEVIRELAESGGLYERVMQALEGAQKGAAAAAGTLTVRFSNLKDAVSQALGIGLTASFETVKRLLGEITDAIYTVDEASGQIQWNEKFISKIQAMDAAAVEAIESLKSMAVSIYDFSENHQILTSLIGDLVALTAKALIAATALRVIVGLFSPLIKVVKALNAAWAVMTGMTVIQWLGSLRLALAGAAAQATALSLAFKGFIIFAAAEGVYNISRLIVELVKWKQGSKELAESVAYAEEQTAAASERLANRLAHISKETGIAVKSVRQLQRLKAEGILAFDPNTREYYKTDAAKTGKTTGDKTTKADDSEQKKIAADQVSLERQLALELLNIAGAKWEAMKEQATQHYEDQLAQAHGNAQLVAQAEALYQQTLADIDAKAAAESSGAWMKSAVARMQAHVETSIAVLEDAYQRGELAIGDYFDRRKTLIEQRAEDEIEVLRRTAEAESDAGEQLRIDTEIYEKEQALYRDLLALARERADAEKAIADAKRQTNQILDNLRLRTQPQDGMTSTHMTELAELDQRHQEEIRRLQDLRATEAQINEAYRLHEIEREKLMATQEHEILLARLQSAKEVFGGMADVFKTLYERGGEHQKEFFLMYKAAALAEAIVTTASMILKALDEGGPFAGPALAAVAAASGAVQIATIASQTLATGGRVAGSSPHDKADNIPIWATANEFMQPVSAVKYYGLEAMEAIRRKLIPREVFSGFALGGIIPPRPAWALASGGPVPAASAAPDIRNEIASKVNIVNFIDPSELRRYIQSEEGSRAILNVVSSRPRQFARRISR